jgi:hypothetical protein
MNKPNWPPPIGVDQRTSLRLVIYPWRCESLVGISRTREERCFKCDWIWLVFYFWLVWPSNSVANTSLLIFLTSVWSFLLKSVLKWPFNHKVTLCTSRENLNTTATWRSSTLCACYWRIYFPLNFFLHIINTMSSCVPECFLSVISNWGRISHFEFVYDFYRWDTLDHVK